MQRHAGFDVPRVETIQQLGRKSAEFLSRFEGGRLSFRKSAILDERARKMET
jgi:hypothetical protein